MFNRSRRRLAYWFALSMGSILVIFAALVYYRVVQNQTQAFDEQLYKKSKAIASQIQYRLEKGQGQISWKDAPVLGNTAVALESDITYVRWYNSRGQLVRFVGATAGKQLKATPGFQTINTGKEQTQGTSSPRQLRQLTLPIQQNKLLIGYLQVAMPVTSLQENLAQTRLFLALGVPVTLGLIGLVGWFLGGVAMQPISQSYEQLQRFTADASHELRAPLAAVLSNAQVGLLSSERTQQHQRLENIVEAAKSMSTLIGNLLFLARHEGQLDPKDVESLELISLLHSLADEYSALATAQGISFVCDLPSEPVRFQADQELLQQALKNLLNNAFKYTPSSGTIHLRLFTQSRRIIMQVEDNGMGIPAHDLPHVFERFYRVDRVRSRQTGNFGLGLSIVQQIVQAHGGRIGVQSVVGKGTTFHIELPLKSKF